MPAKRKPKKPPARRAPASERAGRSGFHTKLAAWLEANAREKDAGALHYGPPTAERLAKVLTAMGEKVNPATVYRWRDGKVLPESRYVPILERLLGAPWSYLDDPKTPWPRRWTREAVADLLAILPDEDVEEFARELRSALGKRGGGARSR